MSTFLKTTAPSPADAPASDRAVPAALAAARERLEHTVADEARHLEEAYEAELARMQEEMASVKKQLADAEAKLAVLDEVRKSLAKLA